MGQRHQFYVIANVDGRYRLLAAAHHQWLYGRGAVRQCLRVLKTLSSSENLPGIRQELRRALGVDWSNDIWIDKSKKQATDSLFTFIATCLLVACSIGSSSCQKWLLNLNIDFGAVANDDGISIYDITEPEHPRYAFIFPGKNVLIDALQYYNRYDNREEKSLPTTHGRKADSPSDVKSCLEFRPVTAEALSDTWPGQEKDFTSRMQDVSAPVASAHKSTLKDQSLARVLDTAFESKDLSWMEEAELLPGFRTALKKKMYGDPEKVLSSSGGLDLLARAFSGEATIDLSPFPLSLIQIQAVLQQAWGDKYSRNRSLSMPDMSSLTVDGLKEVIEVFAPSRLVLGMTAKMTLREQLQAVSNTTVTEFVSHALYKRSLEMSSPYAHKLPNLSSTDFLGLQSQPQICQVIFLKHFRLRKSSVVPRLPGGGVRWTDFAPSTDVWQYNDNYQTAALVLPYRDAPIVPSRIATLSPMLASLSSLDFSSCGQFQVGHFIMNVAKTHASARGMVQPLPAELMAEYYRFSTNSAESPLKTSKLGPNQWTLLVTCELKLDDSDIADDAGNAVSQDEDSSDPFIFEDELSNYELRYAFVCRDEDGETCALNAADFLRSTLGGSEDAIAEVEASWQDAERTLAEKNKGDKDIGAISVGSCDAEEVREALAYLDARDWLMGMSRSAEICCKRSNSATEPGTAYEKRISLAAVCQWIGWCVRKQLP